jgi:methionyl-tRNA formyltransferase
VLSQAAIELDGRETFRSLHDKLATVGATLVADTLTKPLAPKEQDHTKATFCGKLKKSDGVVDPKSMTAEDIDRRVRALTPWPGVTWEANKLLETQLESGADTLPIECKDGTLYVRTIQPPGKKPMTGQAFLRGRTRP